MVCEFEGFAGKGINMANFAEKKNKILSMWAKICDYCLLGFVFVLTSLPLVTVFTSLSAAYYVTVQCFKGSKAYPVRSYFKFFKENVLQGIALELIFLAYAALGAFEVMAFDRLLVAGSVPVFFAYVRWLYFLPGVLVFPWLFTYMARFKDNIGKTLKNAFLLGIAGTGRSVITMLAFFLAAMLCYFFIAALPFVIIPLMFITSSQTEPVYETVIAGRDTGENVPESTKAGSVSEYDT